MTLIWLSITGLSGTQFGWQSDAEINGLDPYAVWADATAFQDMGDIDLGSGVPLLIELKLSDSAEPEQAHPHAELPGAREPRELPDMAMDFLKKLGVELLPAYHEVLRSRTPVVTVHARVPLTSVRHIRSQGPRPLPHSKKELDLRALMSLPRMTPARQNLRTLGAILKRPTIAVIDDGCPFAHVKLRYLEQGQWKSRVAYLWDQSRSPRPGEPANWKQPADFEYGRELTQADIEDFIEAHAHAATFEVDEDACYAAAHYGSVRPRWTHGSVITDIAAGSPDPLAGAERPPDEAGKALIIFVQLPRGAVEDPSGGGLPGYVVDALRYIEARTTDGGIQHPVAINLSYGTFAGPHDGTSPVEVAIDTFLSGRKDCAVTVSAGNAHHTQIHAEVRIASQDFKTLHWHLPPGDSTHNFMEIWLPPTDEAGVAPVVAVRLVPPAELAPPSPLASAGQAWFGVPGGGPVGLPICAVIHPTVAPQGSIGSMALLAVAATRGDPATTVIAPSGAWKVEIHNQGEAPLSVHGWVERDDPSFQLGKQSRFNDPALDYVKSANTLGSFSHATEAIVVGACVDDRDTGRPVSEYSSAGPGRMGLARTGPDFVAGADESVTLPGLRAAATHSADTVRLGGTSVAAAVVTRRVVNEVLSKSSGNSTSQIKAKLAFDPRGTSEGPERVGHGRIKSLLP